MRPLMPPVQTPDNLFHDGNPLTGELGTIVDAEHLNNEQAAIRDTQSELIAILTAAAMEPESTAGQLLAALNKLYAPLNDTLGALSSLVGGANKLPYFTAANAAALTALSSIGRDIIGKETVADVLTYLGLENATKAIIHTGKVIADLNAPPKNSTGFAYQDAQNSPGFNATVLTVDSIEGSYDIQIAIGYNPLKFAFRAYSGDAKVWLNWVVLGNAAAKNTGTTAGTVAAGDDSRITGAIQRTAMVGAVSQTGGAPTGAIIERGSNSNGEYTKFADGTLICWFTRSAESTANNSSGGTTNLYFSSEVGLTFPATFVGTTPTVTPSASLSSGSTSSWPSVRGRSLTGTSLALISNAQNAAAYLGYTAIGRWF
ncbi:hypothetical protein CFNIH1_11495 [Citrobacter freundii CFNIH1]|nr:hypothetical protein CFNIH1_11495 [Citrobacter freundii CFNIH1]